MNEGRKRGGLIVLPAISAQEQGERFAALDAWRGIAALMVALYRLDAEGWFYGLAVVRNAWMFVDFFFVLSGFVIAHAYAGRVSNGASAVIFMVRRFGRVWPLHAVLLAAIVAIELARGLMGLARAGTFNAFTGTRAPLTILWDGLLLQALGFTGATGWNTPAWSISTEFWTYALFALLCLGGRRLLVLAAPVLVIGGLGIITLHAPSGMDTTFDFGFARCIAGFFSGVLVHALWLRTKDTMSPRIDAFGTVEVVVITAALAFVSMAGRGPWSLAAPFVFAAMVYVFAFERGPVSAVLRGRAGQIFGMLSYSIYMTALLVSLVFNKAAIAVFATLGYTIARKVTISGHDHMVYDLGLPLANDLYAVLYIAAVIGISWLTYRLVEDPARLFFNRLSTRLKS
jgi:peptidoglycan/LPS O-acetylase OafA/YrhL